MYSIKKTERIYEPVTCFRDLVTHFVGFGDKLAFRYFTDSKTIAELT